MRLDYDRPRPAAASACQVRGRTERATELLARHDDGKLIRGVILHG
jgi:hypothetical protein